MTIGVDTYIDGAGLTAYATARGITLTKSLDTLLTLSMDYMETRRYSGSKTDELQTLEFPRNGDTTVPQRVISAQCEVCILIDGGVDPLATVDTSVVSEKIDALEFHYDFSKGSVNYTKIDDLLSPFTMAVNRVTRV